MFCSSSSPKLLFTGKFHFERLQLVKMISGFCFHYVWCTMIKITNQFSIECFRATVNVWIKSMNIQMCLYPSFHFLLLSGSESHGQESEQRPPPRPPPHSHFLQLFGAPERHNESNMPRVCPKPFPLRYFPNTSPRRDSGDSLSCLLWMWRSSSWSLSSSPHL